MSVVMRDSRSPVPACSSTPGGSPTDRTRKSSRRSASIRSPSIAPRSRTCRTNPAWTISAATNRAAVTSRCSSRSPDDTRSTSPPSRYGPTIEAITATVLTATSRRKARRCRRSSSATYARTVAGAPTGSVLAAVEAAGS
ncbi:hypothetical protein STENM223S_11160 [Streptomyces tendae]